VTDVPVRRFVAAVSCPPTTAARQFVLDGQSMYVVRDGERVLPPRGAAGGDEWIHLGALDGEPCFARAATAGAPGDGEPIHLRQLFGALDDDDFAIASLALGVLGWDHDHRHCGRCGAATERSATERARVCTACRHAAYPRLSPAIIVLVEHEGRALLARNRNFPARFASCLAGFVELGETFEAAVAREVAEEVGIQVADVRYFGSQPWPLSGSIMIGFTARWAGGELRPDGVEITDVDWYAPDALPALPGRLSISRALIDDFVRRNMP
jgi:NAD+ diphosphatase